MRLRAVLLAALWLALEPRVYAQELKPRAYWPAPTGTNLISFALGNRSGDIVTDPSLPIDNAGSSVDFANFSFYRSFGFAGRTASVLVAMPYFRGTVTGEVDGVFRSRYLSGPGDVQLRLAVNLVGAPAMDRSEFAQLLAKPRPLLGLSLQVQAPTGGYDEQRQINVGSNRYSIRPAIGYIQPITDTWLTQFELAASFFGDNDDYLGSIREQDPVVAGSFHAIYRVRPGFWASFDLNYYEGGRTMTEGARSLDRQENSRIGATLLFPFKQRHALRLIFNTGLATEFGGDFKSVTVGYQVAWRDRVAPQ